MKLPTLLPEQLIHYSRLFRKHIGNRLLLLLVLMLAMSWSEGVGIALFYPMFGQGAAPAGKSGDLVRGLFRFLHLDMSVRGALVGIVGLFLLKAVLMFASSSYSFLVAAQLTRRLRRDLVDSLGRADYQHAIGTDTGFYTNLLVNEVGRFTQAFIYCTRAFTPALTIVVFVGLVLALDWHLTSLCVVMAVTALLIQRVGGRVARRYSDRISADNAGLTALLIQGIQAFKYLRTTLGFERLQKKIDLSADRLAQADYRIGAVTALMFSVTQPILVIFFAGVLYWRSGSGEVSSLFVVFVYFLRIMTELFQLQLNWQLFCGVMGSVDVVSSTLTDLQKNVEHTGTHPYQGMQDGLSCRNLSFGYSPTRLILQQIDFSIPKHAAVAFVGESGAGKSTMVDLLTGTLKPTTGAVYVDNLDLAAVRLDELRARIGYVPQDCILFSGSVAENISLWDSHDGDDRVRDAARRARCTDFVEAMPEGFRSQVGDRGIMLSGGQRQRLAIARELYKHPEILVLDEATSALDTESEREIQASIDALKGQITILIIAHRLSTVRSCDCIYVLEAGRVVESGSYDELYAQPDSRFRRMCALQDLGAAGR